MDCYYFTSSVTLKGEQSQPTTFNSGIFELVAQSSSAPTVSTIHAENSMHMKVVRDEGDHQVSDEGYSSNAGIEEFLQRPVKIQSFTWVVGNYLEEFFFPWNDFLSNAAVQKKLDNYHLLKGNLMLTFYVNGTPFHVGMLLASYRYLDTENAIVTFGGDTQLITCSQRPHLKLNVATNKSGCLCVPFYYPHNYLSLNNATLSATDMGEVRISSFKNLDQLNSGSDSVTITVYAQMQDVKLTAPTVSNVALSGDGSSYGLFELQTQSGIRKKDEYEDDGVISGPASTVAQYAGYLTEAPYIGPFALATQIGANAVGGIARLFGYSKPANLSDMNPMRPHAVSSLALTEGADTSQKLSLTGKQEISVDPRLVGLPPVDEMDLKFLTQKESYLTSFTWDPADTVGTTIFACDVDPMAEYRAAITGGNRIIPTSLSFASRMFSQWCGSLKYRFEFITSNFHRGRLAIIYDPVGNILGTDIYNLTYNTIIDLEEGRDFTVTFKWQQDRVWLELDTDGASTRVFFTELGAGARTVDRDHSNGVFFVQVVNELVVPDGTTPVRGVVSISAGDDFMLQNPGNGIENITKFVPIAQSGFGSLGGIFDLQAQASAAEITPTGENSPNPDGESETIEITANAVSYVLERPLVCYGEVPTHLRQLLKRYSTVRCLSTSGLSGNTRVNFNLKAMSPPVGWDPNGVDSALTGAGSARYNFTGSTLINYLRHAYTGWRGSVRWKFVPNGATTSSLTVTRQTGITPTGFAVNYRPAAGGTWAVTGNVQQKAGNGILNNTTTHKGTAMTVNRTQAGLEVELPYQLPIRFSKTHGTWYTASSNSLANMYPGGPGMNLILWSSDIDEEIITSYIAGGEDFSFHGFMGAGGLYYNTTPTPNPV